MASSYQNKAGSLSHYIDLVLAEVKIDDPIPLYTYLVTRIRESHPDLAYLHVTEPRVVSLEYREVKDEV